LNHLTRGIARAVLAENKHVENKHAMTHQAVALRTEIVPYAESRATFERVRRRLIGLARVHLGDRLRQKVDPEDVVQSVYKSVLVRYTDAAVTSEDWEALWGLLTLITIRKCADRVRYHSAECRDLHREAAACCSAQSGSSWHQVQDREPSPDEALILAEIVEELLADLSEGERAIVELTLQGYSTEEISQQLGRAERSVRRIRERVRTQLGQQHSKTAF
jgi:RNA polymerase sigma-70 factor (ECF subfamily)